MEQPRSQNSPELRIRGVKNWRRGRDSNPRSLAGQRFSRAECDVSKTENALFYCLSFTSIHPDLDPFIYQRVSIGCHGNLPILRLTETRKPSWLIHVVPSVRLTRHLKILALRNVLYHRQRNSVCLRYHKVFQSLRPIVNKNLTEVANTSPRQQYLDGTEKAKVLDMQRRVDRFKIKAFHRCTNGKHERLCGGVRRDTCHRPTGG